MFSVAGQLRRAVELHVAATTLAVCGIVGIVDLSGRGDGVDPDVLVRMRDTLRHRGPDGEGLWISPDRRVGLGHRRLAIVDIAGGAQPMLSPRGNVIVFNGEIYNYPLLRRKLEAEGVRFVTRCDTEVILHLYDLYGEACVNQLEGMFAFAIWDPERRSLFFARDPVGEKPLYWATRGTMLLFASEIKALVAHPAIEPAVNERALLPYLANLVVPAPETLFAGVNKLAPGTCGVYRGDSVKVRRYWDLLGARELTRRASSGQTASTVRELLDRSIHDRLMSDVPVGVLLSGGIDSTTLVALLRERAQGLATFSVGFADHPELDERDAARRVAQHFGTDHHEVAVTEQDAIGFLAGLVHHQDEPLADPVCLPLHFVCQLAAKAGIKVVLAGEGADELFWGYPSYLNAMARWPYMRAALTLPKFIRALLPRLASEDRHPYFRSTLEGLALGRPLPAHAPLGMSRQHRNAILRRGGSELTPGWRPSGAGGRNARERFVLDTQEYEFGLRLPELLLMRIDRFSMASGVEARVPFLARPLVEHVYRLPLEQKLNGGVTKVSLRQAIGDIVPPWVLNRPKQGFGAPVHSWLGTELGKVFEASLKWDGVRSYFDTGALSELHVDSQRGAAGVSLWPVVNFALWHRYWIEGESLDEIGMFMPVSGQLAR